MEIDLLIGRRQSICQPEEDRVSLGWRSRLDPFSSSTELVKSRNGAIFQTGRLLGPINVCATDDRVATKAAFLLFLSTFHLNLLQFQRKVVKRRMLNILSLF